MDAGPLRQDGSDKFFGMENVSFRTLHMGTDKSLTHSSSVWKHMVSLTVSPINATAAADICSYCNSILQCLYYSVPFRESVLTYPKRSPLEALNAAAANALPRLNTIAAAPNGNAAKAKPATASPTARNPGVPVTQPPQKAEDKDSPEYKKKQALLAGPIINMSYDNAKAYGMPESLFTSMKDIFEAVIANPSRMGVVSPNKFLEVLRRDNEMFRTSMHQDAHEFLNLLLNEVVANVDSNAKKLEAEKSLQPPEKLDNSISPFPPVDFSLPSVSNGTRSPNTTRWVHELFEGTLTSETRCLTCENVSQRDEAFLDLSVDLDQHSSVTACLRKFSEEEMLCERNKFHCDNCGGLQEAEKRMKIKRLPKILALHLKRFKYTEDLQRLQKLFHKVVYPYHLRLFNTTDDAEDPDRLYELYAVVVHIGGGPYHGHYVAIIKTEDRGWLLFDDEMVEPVDKSFVRNFFGDRPGLACAYVLFYQETTLEAVQKEEQKEAMAATTSADVKDTIGLKFDANGSAELHRVASISTAPPVPEDSERFVNLDHAMTAPQLSSPSPPPTVAPVAMNPATIASPTTPILSQKKSDVQSKKEKAKEEKERKAEEKKQREAADKAEKQKRRDAQSRINDAHKKQDADLKAAMEASKQSKAEEDRKAGVETTGTENGTSAAPLGGLNRFKRGSKSISHRFSSIKEKEKPPQVPDENVPSPTTHTPDKEKDKKNRFSIRKKSFGVLS